MYFKAEEQHTQLLAEWPGHSKGWWLHDGDKLGDEGNHSPSCAFSNGVQAHKVWPWQAGPGLLTAPGRASAKPGLEFSWGGLRTSPGICQIFSPTEYVMFMILCLREKKVCGFGASCSPGSREGDGHVCSWRKNYQQGRKRVMKLLWD